LHLGSHVFNFEYLIASREPSVDALTKYLNGFIDSNITKTTRLNPIETAGLVGKIESFNSVLP